MSVLVQSLDSGRKPGISTRLPLFAGVVAPCLVALCCSCRTHTVAPPKRVCALSRKISLTGKVVPVDFYLPKGVKSAPVVIIAARQSRKYA